MAERDPEGDEIRRQLEKRWRELAEAEASEGPIDFSPIDNSGRPAPADK